MEWLPTRYVCTILYTTKTKENMKVVINVTTGNYVSIFNGRRWRRNWAWQIWNRLFYRCRRYLHTQINKKIFVFILTFFFLEIPNSDLEKYFTILYNRDDIKFILIGSNFCARLSHLISQSRNLLPLILELPPKKSFQRQHLPKVLAVKTTP